MGERTISHYEILEQLGSGGMGVVYKAIDTRLGRHVALKFLPVELTRDSTANDRFRREARSASALDHPNICTIYEIDRSADGRLFIAMAFYPGETLNARIARGPLPVEEAVGIALQIARGLQCAHEAGIVHRDIKPANIILTQHSGLKILDFGLAKLAGEVRQLTGAGAPVGTVAYMSPEQARGEEVDERTDLWSLGCVLHEMLAGRRPFRGGHDLAILAAISTQEPPALAESRSDVPADVEQFAKTLLEKDPARRPRSAAQAVTRLESLSRHEGVPETQVDPPVRKSSSQESAARLRGRRLATIASVVAGIALAAAAVVTLFVRTKAPPAHPLKNLVVLPFVNLTGSAAEDYLCEGLSAVLIQQLSALPGLNIVGRSDSFAFRNQGKNSRQIAKELGVGAILEGQVLKSGDLLRVQASLTDAENGFVIWSRSLEGRPDEVLKLQEEMASQLVPALSLPLSAAERDRLAKDPTQSRIAYDDYLRAVRLMEQVDNPQRIELASDLLQRAIALDPAFALAHAELAVALVEEPRATTLAEAEIEAKRALELDPELLGAHIALAKVYRTSGRAAEAVKELRSLIAQRPDSDQAYRELAMSYWDAKDLAMAETSFRQAISIRPDYWKHWHELGGFLMVSGDYKGSRDSFERAIRLAPADVTWPRQGLGALEVQEGHYDRAIRVYDKIPRPIVDPNMAANIGTAYFYLSLFAEAEPYYRLAVRLAPNVGMYHRNLGDLLEKKGDGPSARNEFREAARIAAEWLKVNPDDERTRALHDLFLAKAGDCAAAIRSARERNATMSPTADNTYKLAATYAVCGERPSALEMLRLAIQRGYPPNNVLHDVEFSRYANDADFRKLTIAVPAGKG